VLRGGAGFVVVGRAAARAAVAWTRVDEGEGAEEEDAPPLPVGGEAAAVVGLMVADLCVSGGRGEKGGGGRVVSGEAMRRPATTPRASSACAGMQEKEGRVVIRLTRAPARAHVCITLTPSWSGCGGGVRGWACAHAHGHEREREETLWSPRAAHPGPLHFLTSDAAAPPAPPSGLAGWRRGGGCPAFERSRGVARPRVVRKRARETALSPLVCVCERECGLS